MRAAFGDYRAKMADEETKLRLSMYYNFNIFIGFHN